MAKHKHYTIITIYISLEMLQTHKDKSFYLFILLWLNKFFSIVDFDHPLFQSILLP
nr:MAG TPA: hypothetical protein [Caudoviricetes sp.]